MKKPITLKNMAPENTATGLSIIEKLQEQIFEATLNGFNQGRTAQLEDVYRILRGLGYPGASEELKKFMERI